MPPLSLQFLNVIGSKVGMSMIIDSTKIEEGYHTSTSPTFSCPTAHPTNYST
jgi:hypothetical protein